MATSSPGWVRTSASRGTTPASCVEQAAHLFKVWTSVADDFRMHVGPKKWIVAGGKETRSRKPEMRGKPEAKRSGYHCCSTRRGADVGGGEQLGILARHNPTIASDRDSLCRRLVKYSMTVFRLGSSWRIFSAAPLAAASSPACAATQITDRVSRAIPGPTPSRGEAYQRPDRSDCRSAFSAMEPARLRACRQTRAGTPAQGAFIEPRARRPAAVRRSFTVGGEGWDIEPRLAQGVVEDASRKHGEPRIARVRARRDPDSTGPFQVIGGQR